MLDQPQRIRHVLLLCGASLLALTGCSGGNSSMGMSTTPIVPMPMMLSADFDSIQANIFTPICASCHGGANPAAGLNLDATHSYNDLVNVPSTEQPALERVKPGDPTDSFLVIHMQADGDGAPASDIPFISQWIADGALPGNASMSMSSEFRIASIQPETDDTLRGSPSQIIIGFTQPLDASAVNSDSVRLERVDDDSDAQMAKASSVRISLSIPDGNARALMLTPASALPAGAYQVVFDTTPVGALRSLRGESLRNAREGSPLLATRFKVSAIE